MAKSKFELAKLQIIAYFEGLQQPILTRRELARLLSEERDAWGLGKNMTAPLLAKKLVEAKILRKHDFPFPYRSETRYARHLVPMVEVLQSLKPNSYFTHATAMQVNGLLDSPPDTLLINHEQPMHERGSLPEQSRIDAAFKNNPRTSNNIIDVDGKRICMVNGMQTGLLGVVEMRTELQDLGLATIRVTNLERTLIDIAVRPAYAGGIDKVLSAYTLARQRADANRIGDYLEELNYVYPYFQAVGWYMEKAGYAIEELQRLRATAKPRRFYLTHRIPMPVLDETWQVYIPRHLA